MGRDEKIAYTPAPVFHLLDDAGRQFGARPAIDFFGRRWTYRDLGHLVDAAAAGLQALGVARGVNVGLCLPNTPYFVIMYYAILKAGGTVVNFNPLYTEREIATQARDANAGILVTIDLALIQDKIAPLAAAGAFNKVIVCSMVRALPPAKALLFRLFRRRELARTPGGPAYVTFAKLTGGAKTPAPAGIEPERDIAALQFTGGTTGTPKAAMLTHANIGVNVEQLLHTGATFREGQERIAGILPLFHVFAMTAVMNLGVRLGGELLLLPKPEINAIMALIHRRRPTMLSGVPTLYSGIGKAAEAKKTELGFIRFCMSGGAPIAAETAAWFERISGCEILEGYGLSETSPVVAATSPGQGRRGAVGTAVAGTRIEIRDRDHPEVLLRQGEKGEICVRGPQVMPGYYQRPAETAAAFVDGAFRTGDIGYLDADGYLFIVDRIKDLILCGGYNVYPRVIEEAAHLHPAVREAVAIGIADDYRGQAPKLFVSLHPGVTTTPAALGAFLRQHLNKIEIPTQIEIRAELPKTMVGKLSKKELVAEEARKNQAAER